MRTVCSTIVLLALVLLIAPAAMAEDDARLTRFSRGATFTTVDGPGAGLQPAFPDPAEASYLDEVFSAGEAVETAAGNCPGCSGWVFFKPLECWRYVSGSEERIWMYFQGNSNYAYVDTGDARHKQFLLACGNNHWIRIFWTSSTSFTNVRLWYF